MTTLTKTQTPPPLLPITLTVLLLGAAYLGMPLATMAAVTAMVITIASGGPRPQNRDES